MILALCTDVALLKKRASFIRKMNLFKCWIRILGVLFKLNKISLLKKKKKKKKLPKKQQQKEQRDWPKFDW